MKKVNIFLDPFAYYVRLDKNDFEENKNKSSYKKWMEDRKGMTCYFFLTFNRLDSDFEDGWPKITTRLGVTCSRLLSYNPLEFSRISNANPLEAEEISIISENEFRLVFKDKQSADITLVNDFYTAKGEAWIKSILYIVDESNTNLYEKIEFSNGEHSMTKYHLISISGNLNLPEHYFQFGI